MKQALSFAKPATRRNFLALACASALPMVLAPRAFGAAPPPLTLATTYSLVANLGDYLVSEKLDGVRAYWDGARLRFRSGKPIAAPGWFTAKLPKTPLDGELWMGRRKFDVLSGAVRKTVPDDALWQQIQYQIFELPPSSSDVSSSFSERVERIKHIVATAGWAQLQAVAQAPVANEAALRARLKQVLAAGGEGLMLHLASAPYEPGRNAALLKLKAELDAEAVGLAHIPGKGKYAGLMGALEVQTASGLKFKLGTGFSDADRKSPSTIGSTVTYIYRDTTPQGKPRFASFLRKFDDS